MQKLLRLSVLVSFLWTIPVGTHAYPGEACDTALFLVELTSKDVRFTNDTVQHFYERARKERESGNMSAVREELSYAEKNTEELRRLLSAYAGAFSLANAINCDQERIKTASICGFVNYGDGC